MRFNFESKLDYQLDAISSIVDIFKGQPTDDSPFQIGSFYQTTTLDDYDNLKQNIER